VKSSLPATDSVHGVRQTPPFETRASAPGGAESIVKLASSGSKFNDSDEQPANARPHAATAKARAMLTTVS
jgi:hypothetical protein